MPPNCGCPFPQSNLYYLEQSGRKGQIAWGVIDKNPLSVIPPRFLLETKLGNPTRMTREEVEEYWEAWATMEAKGDPLSFVNDKGKGREQAKKGQEDEEEDEEQQQGDEEQQGQEEDEVEKNCPSPTCEIDRGITLPCQCNTPAMRTLCLQLSAPPFGGSLVLFLALVGLVDGLEVCPV